MDTEGTSIIFTGHDLIGRLERDIVALQARLMTIEDAYLDASSAVYHARRNRWYARLFGHRPTFNIRNILATMKPLKDRPHSECIDAFHQYVWEREEPVKVLHMVNRLLQTALDFPDHNFNVKMADLQRIEDIINGKS